MHVFNLIKSNFSIFLLLPVFLCPIPETIANQCQRFPLSSKDFIVLAFKLRSVIHYELIFVYNVR